MKFILWNMPIWSICYLFKVFNIWRFWFIPSLWALMMSVLSEGRSRWFDISNVSSRSWEWHEQRWFPSAFLCRQWDMTGLSRAAHMNRHFIYLSLYRPKYYWLNSYAVQAHCGHNVLNPSLPSWDLNRGPLCCEPSMLPLGHNCACSALSSDNLLY